MFTRRSGVGNDDATIVDHGKVDEGPFVVTAGETSVLVHVSQGRLTVDLSSIVGDRNNVNVDLLGRADKIPQAVQEVVLDRTGNVFVAGRNPEGEGFVWQSLGPVRREQG